jgi:hypothetical protein
MKRCLISLLIAIHRMKMTHKISLCIYSMGKKLSLPKASSGDNISEVFLHCGGSAS